jgi:hypothetical protein
MGRHPQFIDRIVAEEPRKLLKRMSGSVTLIIDLEAHSGSLEVGEGDLSRSRMAISASTDSEILCAAARCAKRTFLRSNSGRDSVMAFLNVTGPGMGAAAFGQAVQGPATTHS